MAQNEQVGKMSLGRIAEAVGVSKATVSWVLSGQGDAKRISNATQKKIKDYAAKHNYQPDMLARSLSLGVTKTVGLLISSLDDTFYSSIAKSIVYEAEHYGYTVMIATSESDNERESRLIETLRNRRVDGLIVTPTEGATWLDDTISKSGRVVLIDRPVPGVEAPFVGVDNEMVSYSLVHHLLDKGLRKIAIFSTAHNLVNMQARHRGYVRALESAGLEVDEKLVCNVPGGATQKMIEAELDRLLEEVPDVDGIFFTSHVLVLPTYVHFVNLGIDPGRGARWACIHSLPEFGVLLPSMSIARMNIERMGAKAMDILIDSIESGAVSLDTKVIIDCDMRLV